MSVASASTAFTEGDQTLSLNERMAHALRKSTYECMVCYDVVRHKDAIWSCSKSCFAVFHAKCIRVWASSASAQTATASQDLMANNGRPEWRCPGCQFKYAEAPYPSCFCGKSNQPPHYAAARSSMSTTPHSCGDVCRKDRKCSHKCLEVCHPGPCEKCDLTAPEMECFCGKVILRFKCADVEERMDLSCGQTCGKLLDCGKHTCENACHEGSCDSCPIRVERDCECGKCTTTIGCAAETRNEIFQCDEICLVPFPCGLHVCEEVCHKHDESLACPMDPSNVETCPCESSTIVELIGRNRENCTEHVPLCDNTCAKLLRCGHICTAPCHSGNCAPCTYKVTLPCRCGRSVNSLQCKDIALDADGRYQIQLCDRVCKLGRSCKRHQCGNVCCPADTAAHYCELQCEKTLKCGTHKCQMACGHTERCHDCFEGVSFDELTCACGLEIMYPPIPCGTKPPQCKRPCRIPLTCGHVSYSTHACHPASEPCPKCMIFGERACACGKSVMKNVPCSRTAAPSCGAPCLKAVDGCQHPCKRTCHTGDCLDATHKCSEKCNRVRAICGHVCSFSCHGKNYCSEDKPCRQMIRETCPCGLKSSEFPCSAWKESVGRNSSSASSNLSCDESCAMAKRNRTLAEALDISPEVVASAASAGTSAATLEPLESRLSLIKHAYLNLVWTRGIEKILAEFVQDASRKLHHLPGSKPAGIKFVVGVAAYYGLEAEIVDAHWGKPSVLVRKVPRKLCSVPPVLVSVLAPQYHALVAAAARASSVAIEAIGNGDADEVEGDDGEQEEVDDVDGEDTNASDVKGKAVARAAVPSTSTTTPVNGFFVTNVNQVLEEADLCKLVESLLGCSVTVTWMLSEGSNNCVLQIAEGSEKMDMSEVENLIVSSGESLYNGLVLEGSAEDVELCWMNSRQEITSVVDMNPLKRGKKVGGLPQKVGPVGIGQESKFSALTLEDDE
ncbi:FKBP12-associated protein [Chytriomyces hyalinus]|nr:FKBP12-associated protein [Chytriomyces hyalinus]